MLRGGAVERSSVANLLSSSLANGSLQFCYAPLKLAQLMHLDSDQAQIADGAIATMAIL
jgi:hypothetical protein